MVELIKILLDEDKDSTYLDKANLFVNKNPLINKTTIQIVKQIKLISSKMEINSITNQKFAHDGFIRQFVKYQMKLKDTPISHVYYVKDIISFQSLF